MSKSFASEGDRHRTIYRFVKCFLPFTFVNRNVNNRALPVLMWFVTNFIVPRSEKLGATSCLSHSVLRTQMYQKSLKLRRWSSFVSSLQAAFAMCLALPRPCCRQSRSILDWMFGNLYRNNPFHSVGISSSFYGSQLENSLQ